MKTIDTCGKLCPQPLIMTRKAIRECQPGESLCILTDNDTACSNLSDYLSEMKLDFTASRTDNVTTLCFKLPEIIAEANAAPIACATPAGYVVVIKSEQMGEGDKDLGTILMRAFINSLLENQQLPTSIVLYNGGVKLALANTDTAESFRQLEEKGVRIMACGTCLDYYDIKDRLAVGQISNMYKITEVLAKAGHIIYP